MIASISLPSLRSIFRISSYLGNIFTFMFVEKKMTQITKMFISVLFCDVGSVAERVKTTVTMIA